MATDIIISKDNLNEKISITDCTDYNALGISIADVNAIRISFSTYDSVKNAAEVKTLKANHEYKIISGTLVVNNVEYTADMVFVAYEDFDFSSQDCRVTETGWFCMPNLSFPQSNPLNTITGGTLVNVYTPSQVGENSTTFKDAFRKVRYDIYTTITFGNVEEGKTYIVYGKIDRSLTLSGGGTYYTGQVFTATSNTAYSGVCNAIEFKDTSTTAFWTDYNAQKVKAEYNKMLNNPTVSISEDFRSNYISCVSALSIPYILSHTGLDYSESDIQNALDYINKILNNQKLIRND